MLSHSTFADIRTDQRLLCACRTMVGVFTRLFRGLAYPLQVALDADPRIVLEIHTGGWGMIAAHVEAIALQDDVRFVLDSATCEDSGE